VSPVPSPLASTRSLTKVTPTHSTRPTPAPSAVPSRMPSVVIEDPETKDNSPSQSVPEVSNQSETAVSVVLDGVPVVATAQDSSPPMGSPVPKLNMSQALDAAWLRTVGIDDDDAVTNAVQAAALRKQPLKIVLQQCVLANPSSSEGEPAPEFMKLVTVLFKMALPTHLVAQLAGACRYLVVIVFKIVLKPHAGFFWLNKACRRFLRVFGDVR
jgi:hypothetical protein